MARPSPSKLPSPPNTALNTSITSPTTIALPTAAQGTQFTPRKEFIPNHRIASTFCLLAFSGQSYVRLYSFPSVVVAGLRRLFTQHNLIANYREDVSRHFYEFTIDGKPWANSKSIKSEKLIVDILAVVFYFGYAFLSTIDYGREGDDRSVMTFSKPLILPASSPTIPLPNASAVSLHQPIRAPFAISFTSQTVMRVIGPPLQTTPAVLAAVRGSWPRGVVSDKKVGDATYEFKLKGYSWFQEDTFATDSLHHILGLLAALDQYGFTLLTSLSLKNRSRVQDLWVFTGSADDNNADAPPSPSVSNGSTSELRAGLSRTANAAAMYSLVPGQPPSSNARPLPTAPMIDGVPHHTRSASDNTPVTSSPLKPKTTASAFARAPFSLLRKPSPKAAPSIAEQSEGNATSPEQSPHVPPIDMTGVGTGRRPSNDHQRTPDVLYATTGRQKGDPPAPGFPFHTIPKASQMYPPPAILTTPNGRIAPSRRSSLPVTPVSQDRSSGRQPSAQPSPIQPSLHSSRMRRSSTPPPLVQPVSLGITVQAPSPVVATSSGQRKILGDDHGAVSDRHPHADPARTPTPHLLNPAIFRDSTLTTSTTARTSYDIPFHRSSSRKGHDSRQNSESPKEAESGDRPGHYTQRDEPHPRAGQLHPELAIGSGLLPPGARSSPSREEHDVGNQGHSHLHPATIREQPSQELDNVGQVIMAAVKKNGQPTPDKTEGTVPAMSPERISPRGEAGRKSEVASMGMVPTPGSGSMGRSLKSTPASTPGVEREAKREQRGTPARKETPSSGWVMVNVESKDGKAAATRGHPSNASSSAPSPVSSNGRPTPHGRSSSDSRIFGSRTTSASPRPYPETAGVPSSMSAAAKAIVMIDAVEAREKNSTGSAFKRLWGRATGSPDHKGHERPATLTRSVSSSRKMAEAETAAQHGHREEREAPGTTPKVRMKHRSPPVASARHATDKRLSMN